MKEKMKKPYYMDEDDFHQEGVGISDSENLVPKSFLTQEVRKKNALIKVVKEIRKILTESAISCADKVDSGNFRTDAIKVLPLLSDTLNKISIVIKDVDIENKS
jgi:hypothetical protein